jgi:hypothetical protein
MKQRYDGVNTVSYMTRVKTTNLNVAKNVERKREKSHEISVRGAFFGPRLSQP